MRLLSRVTVTKGQYIKENGAASMKPFIDAGARPLHGFQLRYIYFLDPSYRARLTVPELPYSEIERMGAAMYKGEKRAGVVQRVEHEHQFETALQGDPPAPILNSSSNIVTNDG